MKKLICLLTALLLFINISYASGQEEFFKFIQCYYSDYAAFQIRNYIYALNMSETEQDEEFAFKTLYTDYIDYYKNIVKFYTENAVEPFDYEYVKEHKKEYLQYGLGFNIVEGSWDIEEDYTMLLNVTEIPKVWVEWLNLQEKYVAKNRKICMKQGGCEGWTMTNSEMEQAIIDLEKIENKSKAIASIQSHKYDYIPYTSRELMDTYLMGNDLRQIFEWNQDDTKTLSKNSKKSFEHFIKHHKNSKYWNIVNWYYEALEQNKFLYSPEINGTLIDKLESMK